MPLAYILTVRINKNISEINLKNTIFQISLFIIKALNNTKIKPIDEKA